MDSDKFDRLFRELIKNDVPEVPELVRARLDATLASLPKRRTWNKKIRYLAVAAVLLFGCIVGLGYVSPGIAYALKQIPVIGPVLSSVGAPDRQVTPAKDVNSGSEQPVRDSGNHKNVKQQEITKSDQDNKKNVDKTDFGKVTLTPQITKVYKDIKINVTKVILTPANTELFLETAWPFDKYDSIEFEVFDDRGTKLEILDGTGTGHGSNGLAIMQQHLFFSPVKGKPEYLMVKPVLTHSTSGEVVTELTGQFPQTISQGISGNLVITTVEYLPDKTMLHYRIEGEKPHQRVWALKIIDIKGEEIHVGEKNNPIQDSRDKSAFTWEFPAYEKGEKLKIVTRQFGSVSLSEKALEIKVPIKW